MAQNREMKLEINPTAPKAEPVKIEQINNRDILRVASQADTIRIPLTDDTWAQVENLVQSNVGTGLTLKDIEGADVTIMKVSANMKPDASSGQKRRNQSQSDAVRYDEYKTHENTSHRICRIHRFQPGT